MLPDDRRARLFAVTRDLLDVAVAFALDEMNESALRAAESLFHQTMTGHASPRPGTPEAYRADRDSTLIDCWLDTSRKLTIIRESGARHGEVTHE